MKKYLIRIQNSVFEGELTKAKFEELKMNVNNIIDVAKDSVIFFKSRDIRWMDKDICGFEKDDTDNFLWSTCSLTICDSPSISLWFYAIGGWRKKLTGLSM